MPDSVDFVESYVIQTSLIEIFARRPASIRAINEIKQVIVAVLMRLESAFGIQASWVHDFNEWSISFRWHVGNQRFGYMQRIAVEELERTYPEIISGGIIHGITQVFRNYNVNSELAEFELEMWRQRQAQLYSLPSRFQELPRCRNHPLEEVKSDYQGLGLKKCKFNAKSLYFRCAPNPDGPCEGCKHYQPIK